MHPALCKFLILFLPNKTLPSAKTVTSPRSAKVGLAIVTSPDLCGAMVEAIGESTYPG